MREVKSSWTLWIGGLLLGLSLSGCSNPAPEPSAAEPDTGEASVSKAEIEMQLASWSDVQAWVDQQNGRVVVIDVWSTFCLPCMREYPDFIQHAKSWGDDVVCASLNVDFYGGSDGPDADVQARVREFLQDNQSIVTNFVSTTPDSDVLEAVEAAAIPVCLVYDQDGNLAKRFTNQGNDQEYGEDGFNYHEHVNALVAELTAAKPAE